jgi:hypothetical protein
LAKRRLDKGLGLCLCKAWRKKESVMAIDRSVYEFYRKKLLMQLAKEEGLIGDSQEVKLLKEIKKQTSDKQSVLQNVAGNFISDGVIFLIKRFFK